MEIAPLVTMFSNIFDKKKIRLFIDIFHILTLPVSSRLLQICVYIIVSQFDIHLNLGELCFSPFPYLEQATLKPSRHIMKMIVIESLITE